jgi:hypothetical protein
LSIFLKYSTNIPKIKLNASKFLEKVEFNTFLKNGAPTFSKRS